MDLDALSPIDVVHEYTSCAKDADVDYIALRTVRTPPLPPVTVDRL